MEPGQLLPAPREMLPATDSGNQEQVLVPRGAQLQEMPPLGTWLLPAALLALWAYLVASAPPATPQIPVPSAPWSDPSPLVDRVVSSLPTPRPSPDTEGSTQPPMIPTSLNHTGPHPSLLSPSLPSSSLVHSTAELGQKTPSDGASRRTPAPVAGDSGQQRVPGHRGVEMVVLVERVERKDRPTELQGASGAHAMALFLAASGLLLCLFAGIYCAYSRGAKASSFAHRRLQDGSFDDLALHLDDPKGSYDWFFYESGGEAKFPTPLQPGQDQPWLCPPLQPPLPASQAPAVDKSLGPACAEQPKLSPPKLECLSPANLPAGNFF